MKAFRRRSSTPLLQSHHVDEFSGDTPSSTEHNERLMPVVYFDPEDRVPSYESSQEQHVHQIGRDALPAVSRSSLRAGSQRIPDQSALQPSPASLLRSLVLSAGSQPPIMTTTNTRSRLSERSSRQQAEGKSLKNLGLKFLNARQHFLLAACRDVSLIPCIVGLFRSWWVLVLESLSSLSAGITSARMSEHFLTGVWCLVAGYLSYSVLDGLMVRWIVTYSTSAAIVRMLLMLTILMAIEQYLVAAFSAEGYTYALHTWILISCALTLLYIVQNFVTSNIDLKGKKRARFFDFYNIAVFAVVPVGVASFITMIGLLRSLLILRLDVDLQRKL